MKKRTLGEFTAAHDPRHKVDNPVVRYEREFAAGASVFIITAAQNATPVHAKFWRILQNIKQHRKAELLVIPLRYKNPTSQWTGSQQNADYWSAEVREYLWNVRKPLNKNLTLLADIKIQPTATSPLTGADALSLASSGIIGHPKMQLKTIPTPSNRMAKILTTTGACTVENYTDSRAGRIGEFHHSIAALIVETKGPYFWIRQLHYSKDGSVTDLATKYTENTVGPAPRALAVGMGDTHVDYIDPRVYAGTFDRGGLLELVRPQYLIYADLLDGYACNPHHKKNPFNRIAKQRSGKDDVKAEVTRAIEFVRKNTPKETRAIIQASNHNDFLRRWVIENEWREDPVNADFYLRTALVVSQSTKMGLGGMEHVDPFAYWFRLAAVPNSTVLDLDQSFSVAGIELGMHGDMGPNGARGSIKNLRRIGTKSIIFHSHAPGIDEGCYQAGTSTRLRLEYNHGASGWLNAHVVLNADGKRQLVVFVDGEFRA